MTRIKAILPSDAQIRSPRKLRNSPDAYSKKTLKFCPMLVERLQSLTSNRVTKLDARCTSELEVNL